MSKRVFIGPYDIASQIGEIALGFQTLGFKTLTYKKNSHLYQGSKVDIDLSRISILLQTTDNNNLSNRILNFFKKHSLSLLEKLIFWYCVARCDVFVFLWSTFDSNHQDLKVLKLFNKKIVAFFVGDDIRWYEAMRQEHSLHNVPPIEYPKEIVFNESYLEKKLKFLRSLEKYADLIFSHPGQSQLAIRPYFITYHPLNLNLYKPNFKQRKIPKILHSPSNAFVKGSKYVIQAIDELKAEGLEFDFELVSGIPFLEILEKYTDTDIVIGQLLSPGGGKQEREALASGCIVMANMMYGVYCFEEENPIIDVNPDTLKSKLRDIILDFKKREQISKLGRQYIEDVTCKLVLQNCVLSLLKGESPKAFIVVNPTFYKNNFVKELEYEKTYDFYDNNWPSIV